LAGSYELSGSTWSRRYEVFEAIWSWFVKFVVGLADAVDTEAEDLIRWIVGHPALSLAFFAIGVFVGLLVWLIFRAVKG